MSSEYYKQSAAISGSQKQASRPEMQFHPGIPRTAWLLMAHMDSSGRVYDLVRLQKTRAGWEKVQRYLECRRAGLEEEGTHTASLELTSERIPGGS